MTENAKRRLWIVMPSAVCLISMLFLSLFWQRAYSRAAYEHISALCQIMTENDPEAELPLLSSLRELDGYTKRELRGNTFLARYGYEKEDFGKAAGGYFAVLAAALFLLTAGGFWLAGWQRDRHGKRRREELADYLERVNMGASGTIIKTQEDEYSQLQDEIYKTVTKLLSDEGGCGEGRRRILAGNLANIAHQLKTPITAASLSVQLWQKTAPNEYAEQVEKQLKRLNRLEEALLILARIDAGTLELERVPVDVYTVLNLAAENLNDLLTERGCRFLFRTEAAPSCSGIWNGRWRRLSIL